MKKTYILFLSIIIPILISCKKKVENAESITKNVEAELNLTDLKEIPKEIDGCSCFFSETEIKYKAEKYLIASNLDSIAYISINDNITKFYLVEKKLGKNSKNEESYTKIFANEKYKATIEVNRDNTKKSGDEVWWNKGSLKIEDENGKMQTKKIIGECGC